MRLQGGDKQDFSTVLLEWDLVKVGVSLLVHHSLQIRISKKRYMPAEVFAAFREFKKFLSNMNACKDFCLSVLNRLLCSATQLHKSCRNLSFVKIFLTLL